MPLDGAGKYHMNPQRAAHADKTRGGEKKGGDWGKNPPEAKKPQDDAVDAGPDEAIKSHLESMQNEHGGQHMHIQAHEGGGHTTHHIGHDGAVQGPNHHPDMQSLHSHIESTMGDGQQEMGMQHMGGGAPPIQY